MHNTHLDVWASYGIIPFVLFVYLLYIIVRGVSDVCLNNLQRFSVFAFMACFVSGIFEASLVGGGSGIYILSCGFLLLAKSNCRI